MGLTTAVKAPNGDYACFAGMWVDEKNDYAYLEPLATPPKYRGLGLARAAVTEAMKKTVQYGAKYCYGGDIDFYKKIGFEQAGCFNKWRKEW
jgi:predicted N-acetyltransferase YhbS